MHDWHKLLVTAAMLAVSQPAAAGMTPWIPFELDGGHINIPVRIADQDTFALIDSGSQLNAINTDFIKQHELALDPGEKIRVRGIHEESERFTYNNVPVELFGIAFEVDGIVAIPFSNRRATMIIGASFFSRFLVQLDYPNQRMRLIDRHEINLAKSENIRTLPQTGSGAPIVEVVIGQREKIWLLLDTGSSGGVFVERKLADKMGWLDSSDIVRRRSAGANTIAEVETFLIPELKFGPYTLENVQATVPAEGAKLSVASSNSRVGSRIRGKRVRGLIGYDVFKHFLLTIDYTGGHMHVGLPE
jgi:hypothetical protein